MNEFHGTSQKAKKVVDAEGRDATEEQAEAIVRANALVEEAYRILESQGGFTKPMPVGHVMWVHISQVRANDYNPNAVAAQEMKLLHTSIAEDGYTMPIVTMWDPETKSYVIVDGFHRYTTLRRYQDVYDSTGGYLPIVVIEKDIADRIASTVRHNRARGKHSVQGMSSLVFQMLTAGDDDVEICEKLGMEAEELARLKHITGFSKLFKDAKFSDVMINSTQLEAKAEYKKEHPDEHVPQF